MAVIFFGPRLWDPDRTPPPEGGPAVCLDCGDHFDDSDDMPCPCQAAHVASEVDASLLLSFLLDNVAEWDGPVAA